MLSYAVEDSPLWQLFSGDWSTNTLRSTGLIGKTVNNRRQRLGLTTTIKLLIKPFAGADRIAWKRKEFQHLSVNLVRRVIRVDGSIDNTATTKDAFGWRVAFDEGEYRTSYPYVFKELRGYMKV